MTYRLDSDFPFTYGQFRRVKEHPANISRLVAEHGLREADALAISRKRDRAAWFVSNCWSLSRREKYVQALRVHFNVDVYGQCGRMKCARENESECWRNVSRDYKFYLSFENSICRDYVTEKLFNVYKMAQNVIPVVLGGANYADLAPPHSYVDVLSNGHENPQKLAKTLREISLDNELFASYFWWREYYEVIPSEHHFTEPMCQMCQALHSSSQATKSYSDLEDWWVEKGHCRHIRIRDD